MMTQAFYTGISGLRSNQGAIDIVSNDIANISTVGYRGYNSEFSSFFEKELATTSASSSTSSLVGLGSKLNASSMDTSFGDMQISDKNSDLAISGNGWFGVVGSEGESLYTRAGSFNFDNEGSLVTPEGNYVLGTMGGNIQNGKITTILDEVKLGAAGAQTKMSFPASLEYDAIPTTLSQFYGNIGREDLPRKISASAIDSQGNKNNIELSFTMTQPQVLPGTQWDVVATAQSLDGNTIYNTQTGKVAFDDSGAILSSTLNSINNNGSVVELNLGSGFDGVTSLSGSPISGSSQSNGSVGGQLEGYEINTNAEVIASFSNGIQTSVGKIAVYHFMNEEGLERNSGSTFKQSSNSGDPLIFKDSNGDYYNGVNVLNYRLEGSNVRMSEGLTELIIYQRSYDANSKSISTANEMMQKALQMDA